MMDRKTLRAMFQYKPGTGELTWRGTRRRVGRPQVMISGKRQTTSKVVWCMMTGAWPADPVVARNGDRSDLRWSNLQLTPRVVTRVTARARKDNVSGVPGISWSSVRGKWRVELQSRTISYHNSLPAALMARRRALLEIGIKT